MLTGTGWQGIREGRTGRVSGMFVLLFPGQGSQRPGMGAPWRDHPSWAVVDRLSEATGRDLADLLLDADADVLRQTSNSQPATFALSLVILDATRAADLPDGTVVAVAGHSLGEYTALVASGALDEAQAARLVVQRGEAMRAAADRHPGTMAAVLGLDADLVAKACEGIEGAWTANDNAPGQIVIAGTPDGVAAAGDAARELGAKRVMPLAVGGAFHSPLMADAQERLDTALGATAFSAATIPVVANVDARAHTEGFAALLSAQLVSPVRWRDSLTALAAMGATTFVELGPGSELSGMVKRTVAGAARANVATPDDLDRLAGLPAGT
jgi:[acyl-carrier-protein] S-malonyltransferase